MRSVHPSLAKRHLAGGEASVNVGRDDHPTRAAIEQIWILTVRDGKISEVRTVSDRLGMFIQLGWDWPTAN
jgi:ketosteroid isomerase-like protein